MTMRLVSIAALAVAMGVFAGSTSATGVGRLAAACKAPNDSHHRWEVTFGTEMTPQHANNLLQRVRAKGFVAVIEYDPCEGYEVSHAR